MGVVLALVLVVGVLITLALMSLSSEPDVPNNSVLVLKVEGSMPDYVNADDLTSRFFGGQADSLSNLLLQLRKAKADKRVGAVMLDTGMIEGGWAKAEEIRDAIADLRKSGKPVYAYMEFGDDKAYYIATAAERVYVPPIGDLFNSEPVIGLSPSKLTLFAASRNPSAKPCKAFIRLDANEVLLQPKVIRIDLVAAFGIVADAVLRVNIDWAN